MSEIKEGRPRVYALPRLEGFASAEVAWFVASLDELTARLIDAVEDLPREALHFIPEGGTGSIAKLGLHMAAAEASWISALAGKPVPESLMTRCALDPKPDPALEAGEVAAVCRAVRSDWTKPILRVWTDMDREITTGQRPINARGVLMHLIWHWTYHSGQVGTLRRLAGAPYRWRFAETLSMPGW